MSKRLFMLRSLLETHPRRASTEARVRTPVIVETEIRTECRGASGRGAIGHTVRPLSQERLDEAFRFAVGLRPVWAREAVADGPAATDGRQDACAIDHAVVGEQPADPNPATMKPRAGPLEKRRRRGGIVGGQDLGV